MEITPVPLTLVAPRMDGRKGRARVFAAVGRSLEHFWRAICVRTRRRPKSLALVESSPLGDRRFVGVVQFEGLRVLIGSSPASITLLARLPDCAGESRMAGDLRSAGDGRCDGDGRFAGDGQCAGESQCAGENQ
jgi:hypothetical protein